MTSALEGTKALAMIQEIELDKFMVELNAQRKIPLQLRKDLLAKKQALGDHKSGELLAARDALEGAKANAFMVVNDEVDEKTGKPKFTNEASRGAAMTILQQNDIDFQAVLSRYRAAERVAEQIQNEIADIEDQIKSAAETSWSLRELIKGATVALQVVATFDGPKLPTEIPLKVTGMPSEVKLTAPFTMPDVLLQAPAAMPAITLTPEKEAA